MKPLRLQARGGFLQSGKTVFDSILSMFIRFGSILYVIPGKLVRRYGSSVMVRRVMISVSTWIDSVLRTISPREIM